MRVFVLGLLLISTVAVAEDQYALVDSVSHQRSGNSFLSFEAGTTDSIKGNVTLNGSMWHQEFPKFQDISVIVTQEAQEAVTDSGNNILVGKVSYQTHERLLQTNQSKIIRKMLISEDGSTMVGLSDDPGPLAIAAIIAGSVVALCTAQVIYNMYQCDTNKPSLTIGFGEEGFQCDARCE